MADYTIKRIDEIEAISGLDDGKASFKRARAALGLEAFGMSVIDMPPNAQEYPDHDHTRDGQEEVYLVLSGGGELEVDGQRSSIDGESIVRVGPGTKRKWWPGSEGMRLLALGGIPGKAYEAPDYSKHKASSSTDG
jgi:mannose-6-phosphate isomerase-like protein (cupin superfamily)